MNMKSVKKTCSFPIIFFTIYRLSRVHFYSKYLLLPTIIFTTYGRIWWFYRRKFAPLRPLFQGLEDCNTVFECLFSLFPVRQSHLHASQSSLSIVQKHQMQVDQSQVVLRSTLTRTWACTPAGYAVATWKTGETEKINSWIQYSLVKAIRLASKTQLTCHLLLSCIQIFQTKNAMSKIECQKSENECKDCKEQNEKKKI